jgi:putative phosphoesterase
MRLAVLADIHGNLPALEAVLEDLARYEPDGILVAGDLVLGGPQPNEAVRRLRSASRWIIRGNGDTSLIRYAAGDAPGAWHNHLQFGVLRWTRRAVDQDTLAFLKELPEQCVVEVPGAALIRVVHGSPGHPSVSIFPDKEPATLDLALAQVRESVLVCGHTHIPWQVERNGRLALNPGAVSGPLDGTTGAQYALLTWQGDRWQAEHHAVGYDLGRLRAVLRETGLLEEGGALMRAFLLGMETGRNIGEDFLAHAYGLAARAGCKGCDAVPDEVWERAADTFDWEEAGRGNWPRQLRRNSPDL